MERTLEHAILTCDVEKAADDGGRTLIFTGSDETVDRFNEVIKVDGWQLGNYKKNPVFLWAHNYQIPPVGKATRVWIQDNKLKFRILFAEPETYPFAETIYQLYLKGFMRATSVGFMPLEWQDNEQDDEKAKKRPRRVYTKQELLELSAVPVPANPSALGDALAAGVITARDVGLMALYNEDKGSETITVGHIDAALAQIKAEGSDPRYSAQELVESFAIGLDAEIMGDAKIEETKTEIRIPAKGEEGKHKKHNIRWITVSDKEGIKGLYCIDCKKIITYVFLKAKGWTLEKAKKWMADHNKSGEPNLTVVTDDVARQVIVYYGAEVNSVDIDEPAAVYTAEPEPKPSQAEIQDDIEFLMLELDKAGASAETSELAWELVRTIIRTTGSDIPDDIRQYMATTEPVAETEENQDIADVAAAAAQAVRDALNTKTEV